MSICLLTHILPSCQFLTHRMFIDLFSSSFSIFFFPFSSSALDTLHKRMHDAKLRDNVKTLRKEFLFQLFPLLKDWGLRICLHKRQDKNRIWLLQERERVCRIYVWCKAMMYSTSRTQTIAVRFQILTNLHSVMNKIIFGAKIF